MGFGFPNQCLGMPAFPKMCLLQDPLRQSLGKALQYFCSLHPSPFLGEYQCTLVYHQFWRALQEVNSLTCLIQYFPSGCPFLHKADYTLLNAKLYYKDTGRGFPDGTVIKNPPVNAGDARDISLISRSGRLPGGGNGNPPQYSCLENPMDRGA